jgi:hypothetical protein
MKNFFILILLLQISIFADVDTSSTNKKGLFIDNLINGVDYSCTDGTSYSGVTGDYGEEGSFRINGDCNEIKFTINNKITIGSIKTKDINKDYNVFITDLVGVDRDDTNNETVVNIIRTLQSLDDDFNYFDGINISSTTSNNIDNSVDLSYSLSDTDLQNIVDDANLTNRTIISQLCALVHFEQTLNKYGISVDTVPPCKPKLAYDINATSNKITYIELLGEKNSKIFLDGTDTNLTLDKDGRLLEFKLLTPITQNRINQFSISYKDDKNQESTPLVLDIFTDTDQPSLNNFPSTVTINTGDRDILDINVTDKSLDNGLEMIYDVNDSRFNINSSGHLSFKEDSTAGTYNINMEVKDQVYHQIDCNLTITVQ